MTRPTDYWLYGLRVRSELGLPELPVAAWTGEPDVTVSLGAVAGAADGGKMQVGPDGATFAIAGIARFSISDGTRIVVEPERDAPGRNVRLFLLGSAMGMLVHQRGLLPLHANTIVLAEKAIVFMGHSGAGKSTLAAWFHDLGHTVLGDDVCVVRAGEQGRATVSAGLPRLRLWKNSLEATGRDHSAFPLSYTGEEGFDKYDVSLDGQLPRGEIELAAVYDLARGEQLDIQPLTGVQAAEAVIANTYRGEYVALAGKVREHWESCVHLVQHTPVFRLERPWDLASGSEIAANIVDHAAEAAAAQSF